MCNESSVASTPLTVAGLATSELQYVAKRSSVIVVDKYVCL